MPWVEAYVCKDGGPPPEGAEPSERIWQADWDSLAAWVASLPRQVKVPALARLLSGRLPASVPRNGVLRLEGEFVTLQSHRLAGYPLGVWSSSMRGKVTVCELTTLPRTDIYGVRLAVQSASLQGAGLWLARAPDAEPGAASS